MRKEQMIADIYEHIASKELMSGCRIRLKGYKNIGRILYKTLNGFAYEAGNVYEIKVNDIEEAIGHPVMIGDVLDYGKGKYKYRNHPEDTYVEHGTKYHSPEDIILELWKHKRKPIEEQPLECIKFVHSKLTNR